MNERTEMWFDKKKKKNGMKEKNKRRVYIDGIQTGEEGITSSVAVLKVRQSVYGAVNNEVQFELYGFEAIDANWTPDNPESLHTKVPSHRLTIDDIIARTLINELSRMFHLDVTVPMRNRFGNHL